MTPRGHSCRWLPFTAYGTFFSGMVKQCNSASQIMEWPGTMRQAALWSAVTVLFTKLPASQFPAIPWFDWYYSIISPFHWKMSHRLWMGAASRNGLWRAFLLVAFWERLITKELAVLWIALLDSPHLQDPLQPLPEISLQVWSLFCKVLKSYDTYLVRCCWLYPFFMH